MERYERSLLQMWEQRRRGQETEPLDAAYAKLGLLVTEEERQKEESVRALSPEPQPEPVPPLSFASEQTPEHGGTEGFIRTACACGHTIRVTRQYAGRTVRCPRCRHPVVIPDKTDFFGPAPELPPVTSSTPKKAQDKRIRFVCTCGKKMWAPVPYAGRTTKCSRCGARLQIPGLSA